MKTKQRLRSIDQLIKEDLLCLPQLKSDEYRGDLEYSLALSTDQNGFQKATHNSVLANMLDDLTSFRRKVDYNDERHYSHPPVPQDLILLG
jgi:hypothetical protein